MTRLDHVCPICEGAGDGPCYCEGRTGLITAAAAAEFRADGVPVRALPPPPAEMRQPCVDCAFRDGSPERESGELQRLIENMAAGDVTPFHCHQGMHCRADGTYVPLETDARGLPIGHPVCAGWLLARGALEERGEVAAAMVVLPSPAKGWE